MYGSKWFILLFVALAISEIRSKIVPKNIVANRIKDFENWSKQSDGNQGKKPLPKPSKPLSKLPAEPKPQPIKFAPQPIEPKPLPIKPAPEPVEPQAVPQPSSSRNKPITPPVVPAQPSQISTPSKPINTSNNKELEAAFKKAQQDADYLRTMSDFDRHVLYGLKMQGTKGDCNTSCPKVGQTMWDAWNDKKGMSREEAKRTYISWVADLAKELKSRNRGY